MPLPNQLPDDFIKKKNSMNSTLIGNRYSLTRKIGSGNFGTAFLIEDSQAVQKNEKNKVLKQICVGPLDPGETVDAMREAKLLSQLKHKNIVQFHNSFMDGQFFCIVLEYCEGGDLECKIRSCKKNNEVIPENQVIRWLKQLLRAIAYMHEKRILHRDLKSRNIFLKDNQIKIGDFGISRILIGTSDKASTFVGTPYYMSPEVLNHEDYDEKCDIWSLGCVLYEICCYEHAFSGTSLMDVMMKIVSKYTPQLPENYTRGLNNILQSMLDREVNKRMNAKEILLHPTLLKVETLPRNSQKFLTARERLRMRKQEEVDAKIQRLKELTRLKFAENQRIRKESQEKNFSRSCFDINMEVQANINYNQPNQQSTFPDEELQGSVVFQPLEEALNEEKETETLQNDSEENSAVRRASLSSTDELILTLIKEGHIPEDSDLANTFYLLQNEFDSSSDEDLPDDHIEMSDSEYQNMANMMEDVLYLDDSLYSKKSDLSDTPSQSTDEELSPGRNFEKFLSSRNFPPGSYRSYKNQTLPSFSKNQSVSIDQKRPFTAMPPSDRPAISHSERPISIFNENMIEQRISNMRQQCIDGLGQDLFRSAYKIASQLRFDVLSGNAKTLEELNKLVADGSKCLLLEQLIYLEKEREAK